MTVNPGIETPTIVEAWELTLPEDEAGCSHSSGCAAGATWRSRLVQCGCPRLWCEEHGTRERAATLYYQGHPANCTGCRAEFVVRLDSFAWHRI